MNYLVPTISSENQTKNTIYAFAGYKEDSEPEQVIEKWRSLGVEPILYKIKQEDDHLLLYDTIKQWADWKNTGWANRKQWLKGQLNGTYRESNKMEATNIISFLKAFDKLTQHLPQIDFAPEPLTKNTPKNKYPITPVDISWLKSFEDNINLNKLTNKTLKAFSQPSSFLLWENLSTIELSILEWLSLHLDKKELISWVIDKKCVLHPVFKNIVLYRINNIEKTNNNNSSLDKKILLFWQTIIDDNYMNTPFFNDDYQINYKIIKPLNKKYCAVQAHSLLKHLKPYIHFAKSISDNNAFYVPKLKIGIKHYPNTRYNTNKLTNNELLLQHAEDFSNLLKEAMDLAKKFEIIKDSHDLFYIERPSIADHSQNKKYYTWTYLIDLVRDSFDCAIGQNNKELTNLLLKKWAYYPYSIFYRLILYAITKYTQLDESLSINLIKNKPNDTLWSPSCQNELFKYLKQRKHSKKAIDLLLKFIIKGPLRSTFKKDLTEEKFNEIKNIEIYHRLNCLKVSGVAFSKNIKTLYNTIQKKILFTTLKRQQ